ncbi:histidine ammonia-lyase [Dethiosulfatibacter aminovorans DSM 17477]|uniref:Histidine ammonia-lyase n=1 Tax=Dethiosulfatibacter aminovorans DSM 17477 TaxID=1121476 RepID=A0A1M6BKC4_9FIRM|nr:aromatic amino acid ammonia-lyase [Dethiosulfatibacter aminovorans]SHI49038.1 histidine ammonia-lyase [Dethiosulfatibacter aminovorans DSM 17477]
MECSKVFQLKKYPNDIREVTLGSNITLNEIVAVARYGAKVHFSKEYVDRVNRYRGFVEAFAENNERVYGITTGLGDNVKITIDREKRKDINRNHLRAHATSVGEPATRESVRAMMIVMLSHMGNGHAAVSLNTLTQLKDMLNNGITPFVPKNGSVGYLTLESHIALVMLGEGRAYVDSVLVDGDEALKLKGMKSIEADIKEGLSLVSGTTSVTAFGALALYDAIQLAKTADISAAMSLEVLKGTMMAFDERIMKARPHVDQYNTASNVRSILEGSEIVKKYEGYRVQDALSLRCIPQLHGAAKKLINDAKTTMDIELNSSVDNPLIFEEEGRGISLMGCNADGSYVGMSMDSINIAAANLGKMAERRTHRMVNSHVSELPPFLIEDPGFNNGFMMAQYTSAGLVGQMRLKSHPATIDNNITCANQEDYLSMGYNASLQAYENMAHLKYILAIEIFHSVQAGDFYEESSSKGIERIRSLVRKEVPFITEDCNMNPYIEYISSLIEDGTIVRTLEDETGEMLF